MKPSRKELESFITEFNKRIQWNKEIRQHITTDLPKYAIEILDYWLEEQELNIEKIDTDGCEIFTDTNSDGQKYYELQAYNFDEYGTIYYWLYPDENEDEYKRNRIKRVLSNVNRIIKDNHEKIEKLAAENLELEPIIVMLEGYENREK